MDTCLLCTVKWESFLEHPRGGYENTVGLLLLIQFLWFHTGTSVLIWDDSLQSGCCTQWVKSHPLPSSTTVRSAKWKTEILGTESKIEPQNLSQHTVHCGSVNMAIKRKYLASAVLRIISHLFTHLYSLYIIQVSFQKLFFLLSEDEGAPSRNFVFQINIFHFSLTFISNWH